VVLRLLADADVLVEGFRPGVAERLGIGPDACRAANPRLIYARMTGWGQEGPLAARAGHDIDYAAIAGALHTVGRSHEPPPPPVNYLADFGGGGTFLAIGVLAALLERERSGEGQVIDVAMVDGAASQTAFLQGLRAMGAWSTERGTNLLDGGAPVLRHLPLRGRPVPGRRRPRAAVLRRAVCPARPRTLGAPAARPGRVADPARAARRAVRDQDARRVGGALRGLGCLRGSRPRPRGGAGPPPQRRPAGVRRRRRFPATGARPPLLADPGRGGPSPTSPGQHTDEILAELGWDAAAITRLRDGGTVA
jgi:alpha-methylacyl-CoA racemase